MTYAHKLSHTVGDLIESDEFVIAHGCNTQGVMGAGVAGLIARKWPEVESIYMEACRTRQFGLGAVQVISVLDNFQQRFVVNLGTQRHPGRDGSYWAVLLAFGNLFERCRVLGVKRVAIPRIGCGIAGLDWKAVEYILTGIYEYVPDGPELVVYTHPSEVHKWL